MGSTTYNGWTNRETWLANLWLTNEGGYKLLAIVSSVGDLHVRADILSELMHEQLADECPGPNLWNDLLSSAFERINWREVIEQNR